MTNRIPMDPHLQEVARAYMHAAAGATFTTGLTTSAQLAYWDSKPGSGDWVYITFVRSSDEDNPRRIGQFVRTYMVKCYFNEAEGKEWEEEIDPSEAEAVRETCSTAEYTVIRCLDGVEMAWTNVRVMRLCAGTLHPVEIPQVSG